MSYPNDSERWANGSREASSTRKGPHPSFIQVAKPYIFEQEIQYRLSHIKVGESKEAALRLQGVTWIENVRKALQLPIRTYNTAVVYYHKFRLVHSDSEYDYRDAAAASLFSACKIEDTLKKSRDILCAAYNLKLSPADQLSPDDSIFDNHAKTIVGLERLMLEASGFDFRSRHPQKLLIKFARAFGLDKQTVGIVAYKMLMDLYRTFAPLKQTSATMAHACLELAIRLSGLNMPSINSNSVFDYSKWVVTREEIMETILDLLDLYTHHRSSTIIGPDHSLESFINIRIELNQESKASGFPRFTKWDSKESSKPNGYSDKPTNKSPKSRKAESGRAIISPQSPAQHSVPVGERGKDGTVRFMLDVARMKHEKTMVQEFFRQDEAEDEIHDIARSERSIDSRVHDAPAHSEPKRKREGASHNQGESRRRADYADDDYYDRTRYKSHNEASYRRRDDEGSPRSGYDSGHSRQTWDRGKYRRELGSGKRGKFTLASWRDQ